MSTGYEVYSNWSPSYLQDEASIWGKEVLIEKIPYEITLENLIEISSFCGPVQEIRFARDRGKAHFVFKDTRTAIEMVESMNGKNVLQNFSDVNLRDNNKLSVKLGWDYPFVIVEPLSSDTTIDDVTGIVSYYGGMTGYKDAEIVKANNKTFAILEYHKQCDARKLISNFKKYRSCTSFGIRWHGAPCLSISGLMKTIDKKLIYECLGKKNSALLIGLCSTEDSCLLLFENQNAMNIAAKALKWKIKIGEEYYKLRRISGIMRLY